MDLSNAKLSHELKLERCRFRDSVKLVGLRSEWPVSLAACCFNDFADFHLAQIHVLSLEDAIAVGLRLSHSDLGDLDMRGFKSSAAVSMSSLTVRGSLFLSKLSCSSLSLVHSSVSGSVELDGYSCDETLDMNALKVGASLYLSDGKSGTERSRVVMRRASVGGNVELDKLDCKGQLLFDWASVGGSVFIRGSSVQNKLDLSNTSIRNSLDFSESRLSFVDLTGVKLGRELRLGTGVSRGPDWGGEKRIVLQNAHLNTIQDSGSTGDWPALVDLDGCAYRQLGGYGARNAGSEFAARPPQWFLDTWFARGARTFQPYQQLASVLRQMGYTSESDEILYAGKEAQRKRARTLRSRIGLWLLKSTIGYGYGHRYFRIFALGQWVHNRWRVRNPDCRYGFVGISRGELVL